MKTVNKGKTYTPKSMRITRAVRRPMFGIGIREGTASEGFSYSMTHGPYDTEQCCLDSIGCSGSYIIHFCSDDTDIAVWKWDENHWLYIGEDDGD